MNIRFLISGFLLPVSLLSAAPWGPPENGDLILGFQAGLGSEGQGANVFYNLGSVGTIKNSPNPGFIVNLNAELTSAFGSNWYSRTDVYFGAYGQRSGGSTGTDSNGDPNRTAYLTRQTDAAGGANPHSGYSSIALGAAFTIQMGMIDAFSVPEYNVSANSNGVVTVTQSGNGQFWANSWTKWNPVSFVETSPGSGVFFPQLGPAFVIYTGGIQNNFGKGSSPTRVDIQRLARPTSPGTATATYVATIQIASNGDVFVVNSITNANLSALALSSGTLNPDFVSATTAYTTNVSHVTTSVTVTPSVEQPNATIEARINGGTYASVTSGSPSGALALNVGSNTLEVLITAQDGVTQKTYTVTVTRLAPPSLAAPTATSVTATEATLGGTVTDDGADPITERGVVYAVTATNADPVIDGVGVVKVATAGTTGIFTTAVSGLTPGTAYSFKAYATNSQGTGYSATGTFTTEKVAQTITFTNPGTKTYGDAPFTLDASGGGSGNPVTFTIVSGPASVTGAILTLTGAGSVTVRASQAGSANFFAAPDVEQSFTVNPKTLLISADAKSKTYGSVDPAFTYTSSGLEPGDAITGALTRDPGDDAGSYPIRQGTISAGTNYAIGFTGANLTIGKAPQTITFPNPGPRILGSQPPFLLVATGGASGNAVTFVVVDGPATVDQSTLTLTGTGSVTVKASQAGNANYSQAADVEQTFSVSAPDITLAGFGMVIASGAPSPSSINGTDFETVAVMNTQTVRRFTVGNAGTAPLNLTGNPRVAISGAHAADFTVTALPASTVPAGEATTFDLTFDPSMPGPRTATVTISSDDPDTPSFTFAVAGFGALATPLNQTISFAPPATVYLSQSPLTLEASASSGLPVTFVRVSGPATLSGNALTIIGPGTIRVQAVQPGGGNYRAAAPVTRSIIAAAEPTSLTLTNLTQVYDGTPKEIGYVGAANATIFYTISGREVDTAPIVAGSYRVVAYAGTVIKTGTLVIAKKPLTVTPDDKRKFAGQPNPTLTATITGFVGGDSTAVLTRQPVLRTTATAKSAGGHYPITASGAADENYSFLYQQGTLVVETFAGTYEGLLRRQADSIPVGKLAISVASSSKTFSARLFTETFPTFVTLSGPLTTDGKKEEATGSAQVRRSGTDYSISFTLPLSGNATLSASRNQVELGRTTGGRKLPSLKNVVYAGAHTAILQSTAQATDPVPRGAGWATASLSKKGILSLRGRLADGTQFTAAASPDAGEDPGYRLFTQPYKPARTGSWMAGEFALSPHPDLPNRRFLASADMTWAKGQRTRDANYRTGFGPVTTTLGIDPWLPPVAATRSTPGIPLAQRLGLTGPANLFEVQHTPTGSDSNANLSTALSLGARDLVSVTAPLPNLTKWRTTFVAKTGTFSGSFELLDNGKKRPVSFSGVLRQAPSTSTDDVIGDGYYLLPALPGAASNETVSGEVLFQTPAPPAAD